ncbi:MAG: minor capsid protein [Tissierella sp.]|nr:minor capsid protein [Tissierella sp.]
MRTNKYWQKRFTLLTESLLNKGERYYRDLEIEYEKAISTIQSDLRDFYGRYGGDISYADTNKLLTPRELRKFKLNIGDYMDAADRERVSRLHSLQYQIRQQVEVISATRLNGLTKLSEELIKEGYYRSIYEVQKGFGLGDTFTILDTRTVESIIARPWAPDGSNFSERIWKDTEVLVNELQKELAQSFIRGDAPDTAIRNISKKMEVSKRVAGRLIMTESAFFANEARARAFKELGVEEYQFLATLDMRTSDICQDMDLRIFKLSEREIGVNWPPLHVWCRSTVVPHFEGNIKQRWARDPKTGKGYKVPGDMNYKDWHSKHVA